MRRAVVASAKAIHNDLLEKGYQQWTEQSGAPWRYAAEHEFRCMMLTLTYREAAEWSPKQLAEMLNRYRIWAKRNKCLLSYVWVMEFHASGRPHYHAVFWITGGKVPPFPDAAGWWTHGHSNAKWAHSPVGYIVKYASKGSTGTLPKGARLYGAGGLSIAARAQRSYTLAPKWFREIVAFQPEAIVRRVPVALERIGKWGKVITDKTTAWTNGVLGLKFLSPWQSDGWSSDGVALRHLGYVEMFTDEGDFFHLPHTNPFEA
ncbi:hypothetical protein A7A76_08515 [Lysobacter enzymogenes]|nr:hypothetical protein [Lysobacter enzymogenes]